ncbi:MAG: cobalt ECF transporter T component CbiQ [Bacillota bacterium]
MSSITGSFYNIRLLDELAEKKTMIHGIHPLIKILTTFVYLVITVSFHRYEISGLLPLVFYPVIVITLADIPVVPLLKRMMIAAPFIIVMGAFNPLFDTNPVLITSRLQISGGWISFVSILIKGILTILAAFLLISTTGMTRIASALRSLKIPRVFIMQLLLTYRYIAVLVEEVSRTVRAYSSRSPGEKGIKFAAWGSLTGQLLLRSMERAQRIYQSMCCRGFSGEYHVGENKRISLGDMAYFLGWSLFFIIVRYVNITAMMGSLITGA